MTLEELTNEIERQAAGKWTFATRRQRKRLVALTIEALPASYDDPVRYPEGVKSKVRALYRERYGINPFIILAIEIIVKLVIEWWLSRANNVLIANEIRSQGRVL